MNNFLLRTLTGIAYVILLVSSVFIGKLTFFIFFQVVLILGIGEFYNLAKITGAAPQKVFGTIIGIILFLLNYLYASNIFDGKIFIILVPLLIGIFVSELYRKSKGPFTNIAFTFLGLIYVALPLSLLSFIAFTNESSSLYNPHLIFGFFLLLWASDTGAYLAGKAFGRNKLFERISPKKTWEGLAGGLALTILLARFVSLFYKDINQFDWLIIGGIIAIMGVFGDLTESLFKRSLDIKDSGKILPGHGGILDRFDSVLLSAPLVFAYFQFMH